MEGGRIDLEPYLQNFIMHFDCQMAAICAGLRPRVVCFTAGRFVCPDPNHKEAIGADF
jgi:hypothetical protein